MKALRVAVMLLIVTLPVLAQEPANVSAQTPESLAGALRAGEAINGFPNWSERVIHAWMNRARVDPQIEMSKCGPACGEGPCYKPVAPLTWNEGLNRASRYHADEMVKQGYFGHDSKCTVVSNISELYPAGCDGSASCGCVGGATKCGPNGCTPWTGRIALFGQGPGGEIIAGGADPNQAFYLWLFENGPATTCGLNGSNIHRWLILQYGGGVGVGVSGSSVADFGGGTTPYKIPSGSHYPRQAASVEVWANWYDSAAPRSASVVVDGKCTPLTLKRGSQTNGAWSATLTNAGSGCHRYYFSFVDSTGAEVTYPATGSLGIGNESCADWNTSRSQGSCLITTPPPPPPPPPAPKVMNRRRAVKHRG